MTASTNAPHVQRGLVAALFIALTVTPLCATAQPQKDRAGVLERFDAGQKLFDQKQYDDALVVFRKVYTDTASPNARLMVARCYLALGQTAAGYDELAATVREAASKAQTEPKYARTRDAAAAELAALEPRVGKIIVAIVDESSPTAGASAASAASAGLTVSLTTQGAPGGLAETKLSSAKIGVPVAVLPGSVVVLATRPDGTSVRREERVLAGETKTISVVFGRASAPAALAPVPPPSETPVDASVASVASVAPVPSGARTGGQVRVAGFVTAALGVAGFAVFGATFAVAQNDYNSVKNTCGNTRCTDPKVESTIDSGKTYQLVSNVMLPVASVLTVAGVGMIVFGGPKTSAPVTTGRAAPPQLSLSMRPNGIEATLSY